MPSLGLEPGRPYPPQDTETVEQCKVEQIIYIDQAYFSLIPLWLACLLGASFTHFWSYTIRGKLELSRWGIYDIIM